MKKFLVAALITVIQILLCFLGVYIFDGSPGLLNMDTPGPDTFVICAIGILNTANLRIVKSWEP